MVMGNLILAPNYDSSFCAARSRLRHALLIDRERYIPGLAYKDVSASGAFPGQWQWVWLRRRVARRATLLFCITSTSLSSAGNADTDSILEHARVGARIIRNCCRRDFGVNPQH